MVQANLGITDGGIVTGYFLDGISTGILSIPSFYSTGYDTVDFFISSDYFINNATEKKIEKVIIDLQQNSGGLTYLAISTFKRFFYGINPWIGSRIRSHEMANILGQAYSEWWDSLEVGGDGVGGDDIFNELYQIFAGSE
jgi:hypothetical protein